MVVKVEVKTQGAVNALTGFIHEANKIVDEEMQVGAEIIMGKTSAYPPELPNQQYVRTGIYGAAFSILKTGEGQRLISSHAVQQGRGYSPWVGGGETGGEQAAIHQGRWPVFLTEAENEAENTADRIEDGLDKLAKGL